MSTFAINDLTQLPAVAASILSTHPQKIWAFYGEMGAGKTTLIKEICKCLGVTNTMSSPTYSIVNEYHTNNNNKIYHFDFYRIKLLQEAVDIGCEEYFESGSYCFIEWPEKIGYLLPNACLKIKINLTDNENRVITIVE